MTDRDPFQTLWINQQGEDFTMSLEQIRARAMRLQSVIARRNLIEYVAGAIPMVVFSVVAVIAPGLLAKIASGLIVAGVAFVLWQLHAKARAASADEMAALTQGWADFYRRELVRQRDALATVWRWYLGPLIPGMVVFWLSVLEKGVSPWNVATAVVGLAITAALFVAIAGANARGVRMLQGEIDALDAARKS